MTIYNIPGWKNSDVNHWQSIWEYNEPDIFQRINQEDWLLPKKEKWSTEIGRMLKNRKDYWVTCHSIGCMAFVHAANEYNLQPKGALFVAPSDPEQLNYPKEIQGFTPIPLLRLNFPTVVLASSNDQAVSLERAGYFAKNWGATFLILENAGHIESKSGFGAWKEGRAILDQLHNNEI